MRVKLNLFIMITSLLIVGMLLFVGCETTVEEEHAEEAVEEEIGVEDAENIIQVGVNDSLSGSAAVYGLPQYEAIQLAAKQINEAGGIDVDGTSYMIELVAYDNEGDPTEGVAASRRLVSEDGVKIIVGFGTSGPTSAAAPYLADEDVLALVGTAAERSITAEPYDNIFRTRPPADYTGGPAGAFMATQGYEKIAVLGQLKDTIYQQYYEAFKREFEEQGYEILVEESFSLGDRDFYAQLTSIQGRGDVEAIFVPGYIEQNAFIYRQASELGIEIPIYGFTGGTEEQFLEVASIEDMQGIWDLRPTELTLDVLGDTAFAFVEEYEEMWGRRPTPNAPYAYDQMWVMKNAIEAAGTIDDVNALINAVRDLEIPEEVVLEYIPINGKMFEENGQAYTTNIAMVWEGDGWVVSSLMDSDPEGYSAFLSGLLE